MATNYSGNHEGDRGGGRGLPSHLQTSGYQVVNEDGRGYGRRTSMEYPPPGGGVEPRKEHYTLQGATGIRTNTIQEEGDYHMGASYPQSHPDSDRGFTGPEPIIHSPAEFDDYIKKTQNTPYSNDAPREDTENKPHSAVLRILKPVRYEMPNHPSYHGELTSKEAEGRLSMAMPTRGNCYLTRYSKSKESYVLSAIVFHDGIREPVHLQLTIDTEKGYYSLEGSQKIFRTLDELLGYFENNPLSSDIRNIGSICPRPEQYQDSCTQVKSPTTGMTKEYPDNPRSIRSPSTDSASDTKQINSIVLEMQKNFIEELSKQREEHKKEVQEQREEHRKEMVEERKLFKEELEKERQMHKEQLEVQKQADQAKLEAAAAQAQDPKPEPQKNVDDKKKKDDCTIL